MTGPTGCGEPRKEIEFSDGHWDCECKRNYIQLNKNKICVVCHKLQEDQPPSRLDKLDSNNHADDYGECHDCPGAIKNAPFQCSALLQIRELINMHSGMVKNSPNRMEIQVTHCHHKTRMIKEESIETCDMGIQETNDRAIQELLTTFQTGTADEEAVNICLMCEENCIAGNYLKREEKGDK